MHEAVELGLRIRITAQGITGVNYLELDFVSPERFPALKVPWGPEFFHVPSIPSTAARVQSAAETLLQRLQETKLPELVDELAGLAVDLRAQLRDGDVAQALREAGQLMVALRTAAEGAALPQLSGDLRAALAEGQATLAETRRAVAELRTLLAGREARQTVANLAAASADLRTAIQRVPGSLAALDQTLRAARGSTVDLQAELVPLLRDLRATLANLRDTTEALRRAPSQAIFGAPPPADPRR
jgi:paraquat-inducible protein B